MSEPEVKIVASYCRLMEEIKERHTIVETCLLGPLLPPKYMYELCYLQFRMTCELIALASLLVHRSVRDAGSNQIQKAYSADWIMNHLEKLHPDFYPVPIAEVPNSNETVDITDGFLTKNDLIALNHKCGDVLHRGRFKHLFSKDLKPKHSDEIHMWSGKIIRLLNHHRIIIANSDYEIWVMMNERTTGKVTAATMKRIGTR